MSKEKQIKEMAKIIANVRDEYPCRDRSCINCPYFEVDCSYCEVCYCTEYLYNAGYRKQSEGKWTNIAEDGFPKEEGEYFVWNAEQRKREIRFFFRLPPNLPVETNPEVREYFGNSADHKKITHWMPLPEPPKGEWI